MFDKKSNIYLVGGGIASLSAALYLIKDGGVKGEQIRIFDGSKKIGGSLDAKESSSKKGYIMRGIRMFEKEVFSGTRDLMSKVPSLKDPEKTIGDEYLNYNKKHKTYCETRLLRKGKSINGKPFGLSIKDRLSILKLLFSKESSLDNKKIEEIFTPEFFKSNFWYEFCTVFAFQTWHSLIEFRRYLIRFIHTLHFLDTLEPVEITPYNQYESMVLPLSVWLKKEGVNFIKNTKITNLEFEVNKGKKRVSKIFYESNDIKDKIGINKNDLVFVTPGSMIANSSNGSMTKAPVFKPKKKDIAWTLWENIAKDNKDFGRPKIFNSSIDKSKWVAFTITFKDPTFFKLMKKFVNKKVTAHGGITLTDSNWFMSVVLFHKPYFLDQPKDIKLSWGYSLFSDKKGNFVKKKMIDCSGEEILTELIYHLKFEKYLDSILKNTICIPSMTPYVTSHFLPRKAGDRPQIIPKNTKNFAFLGQFCEIPKDIVFTVEYSIRSAQIAVNSLLKLNNKITPIYKGTHNIKALYNLFKALFR